MSLINVSGFLRRLKRAPRICEPRGKEQVDETHIEDVQCVLSIYMAQGLMKRDEWATSLDSD